MWWLFYLSHYPSRNYLCAAACGMRMALHATDVIYQVFLDRFARGKGARLRGDPAKPEFYGGNLRGVIERLDYIASLGCTALWLSPFTKTSAYHGYHITDFFSVDERFGTLQDLQELITRCHKRRITVIMDFVPNHTSRAHPFFREATRTPDSPYVDWYCFDRWPDDYRCFLDVRELPKVNLEHPPARAHLIAAAKHWLDVGIDGFRLDHVCGSSHDFWRAFMREIKQHKPEAFAFGEATLFGVTWKHRKTLLMRNARAALLLAQMGIDNEEFILRQYEGLFDGLLDFSFRRIVVADVAERGDVRAAQQRLVRSTERVSFLDNHDVDRFLFLAGGDKERLHSAAELQFAQPGPAIIYNGTERGMAQERPIAAYHTHGDLAVRQPIDWRHGDEELIAHFTRLAAAKSGRARNRAGGS